MHSNNWHEVRIGDLGKVFTGRTPSTSHASYFGQDVPFITPGDMHQGKYARKTERSLSQEGASLLKRITLPANSVCVSCIGWQMGEVIMTDRPSFSNQQLNTIVPNDKIDPSFLYYSMLPRKQELLSLGAATGVRTPILNKSAFCDLKLKLPPLPVQKKIAGILSAYDDLIENNQRRIKILEEMARKLYREWFVHFRFSGHEKIPLVDSPLGKIPQGWEVKTIGNLTSYLNRGIAPNYDENANSIVINQKCIRDQRLDTVRGRRHSKSIPNDKLIRYGDVLINSTGEGTLGRVAQVYQNIDNCTVDTHVTIARPSSAVDFDFFGCALLNLQETFERLGLGATGQTELSRTSIANIEISIAPSELQECFGKSVMPIRTSAIIFAAQNKKLQQTRDLLLPYLLLPSNN